MATIPKLLRSRTTETSSSSATKCKLHHLDDIRSLFLFQLATSSLHQSNAVLGKDDILLVPTAEGDRASFTDSQKQQQQTTRLDIVNNDDRHKNNHHNICYSSRSLLLQLLLLLVLVHCWSITTVVTTVEASTASSCVSITNMISRNCRRKQMVSCTRRWSQIVDEQVINSSTSSCSISSNELLIKNRNVKQPQQQLKSSLPDIFTIPHGGGAVFADVSRSFSTSNKQMIQTKVDDNDQMTTNTTKHIDDVLFHIIKNQLLQKVVFGLSFGTITLSAIVSLVPVSVLLSSTPYKKQTITAILSYTRSITALIEIVASKAIGTRLVGKSSTPISSSEQSHEQQQRQEHEQFVSLRRRLSALLYNTILITSVHTILIVVVTCWGTIVRTTTGTTTTDDVGTIVVLSLPSVCMICLARFTSMLSTGFFFLTISSIISDLVLLLQSLQQQQQQSLSPPIQHQQTMTTTAKTNVLLSRYLGIQNSLIRFGLLVGSLGAGYLSKLSTASTTNGVGNVLTQLEQHQQYVLVNTVRIPYLVATILGSICIGLIQYGIYWINKCVVLISSNNNNNNKSHTSSSHSIASKASSSTTIIPFKSSPPPLTATASTTTTLSTMKTTAKMPLNTTKLPLFHTIHSSIIVLSKLILRRIVSIPIVPTILTRHSTKVRILAIILVLQMMPMFSGDYLQIYAKEVWHLSMEQFSSFIALFAIIGIVSDVVSSTLIPYLGIKWYTTIATISNIFCPLGACLFGYYGTIVGLLFGVLGPSQSVGIMTCLITETTKETTSSTVITNKAYNDDDDRNNNQTNRNSSSSNNNNTKSVIVSQQQSILAGERATLLATVKVIGPILYSTMYVQGQKKWNVSTLPFVWNIMLGIVATVLIQLYL